MHYKRMRKHGDPSYEYRAARRPLLERFREKLKINVANGCLEWQGAHDRKGYGRINLGGEGPVVFAHRLAWELDKGGIRKGLCVLHKCDNPKCCNVKHLFLGSIPDNNADMDRKGRRKSGPLRGEAHPQAVMTVASVRQVRRLRATGLSAAKIAARLDVNLSTVSNIVHGDAWKHVT